MTVKKLISGIASDCHELTFLTLFLEASNDKVQTRLYFFSQIFTNDFIKKLIKTKQKKKKKDDLQFI